MFTNSRSMTFFFSSVHPQLNLPYFEGFMKKKSTRFVTFVIYSCSHTFLSGLVVALITVLPVLVGISTTWTVLSISC